MARLLVIDEDSGRRLILRSRLSEAGHALTLAENGARGLVEARSGLFDAVLVDARLSLGIDGCEVCRRLKAVPERAHVPVVIYVDDPSGVEEMARAYDAGCDAFLARPELPALEHVLRALARHRARLEELMVQVSALGAAREAPRSTADALRPAGEIRTGAELRRRAGDRGEPEPPLSPDHAAALRELASGRPDGVLLVDAEGLVRHADRGASELLGGRIEGAHLGSLVPASGLEAFVRDARVEAREGLRFDLPPRRGRLARTMLAVVVPLLPQPREEGPALRIVALHDGLRRRLAAEALRVGEPGLSRSEATPLIEAARELYRPCNLLGASPSAERLREEVAHAATGHDPVLLLGERGSGRRRVARTIHWSGTATGSFVTVNCGAHTEDHLEQELFGLARANGSAERPGLFHLAQDGTLYLEDVNEMPPALQARLLRFLETGSIERRGSPRSERLDVRIVASSSAELSGAVAEGRFLADLLARLNAHAIRVPGLAGCPEDVEPLALAFVRRFGGAHGVTAIGPAALSALREHNWQGHAAELESCLERACAHARGPTVALDDLPRSVREHTGSQERDEMIVPRPPPHAASTSGTHRVPEIVDREITPHARPTGSARDSKAWDIADSEPVSLELYERKAILRAIAECGGDKLAAARLLKLGKSTLYRKLKRYSIT